MSISIHERNGASLDLRRLQVLVSTAMCIGLLCWAIAATSTAWQRSQQVWKLQSDVVGLTYVANAASLEMLNNQQLHQVYGNLYKYDPCKSNIVGIGYLHRFDTRDDTIAVFLRNESSEPVSASFEIRFLNAFGFVTETYRSPQPSELLAPKHGCVCKGELTFRHGEPVYYAVELLE